MTPEKTMFFVSKNHQKIVKILLREQSKNGCKKSRLNKPINIVILEYYVLCLMRKRCEKGNTFYEKVAKR